MARKFADDNPFRVANDAPQSTGLIDAPKDENPFRSVKRADDNPFRQNASQGFVPKDLEKEKFDISGPIETAKATGAGIAQGGLSIGESVFRTPEAAGRILALMSKVTNDKSPGHALLKRALDPKEGLVTRGFKVGDVKFHGFSDVADEISAFQRLLPELSPVFRQNQELGLEADKGLETLIQTSLEGKPNARPLMNVALNPKAWGAFIGQAVPSLAAAYASGGSLGFISWLEGMGVANDAASFEKETGLKVSPEEFTQSVSQAAIINAKLEKIGLDKVVGPLKSGSRHIFKTIVKGGATEALTEGLQEFNSNLAKKLSFDKKQKLLEGVVSSVMGGFGAGTGGATLSSIVAAQAKKANLTPQETKDVIEITKKPIPSIEEALEGRNRKRLEQLNQEATIQREMEKGSEEIKQVIRGPEKSSEGKEVERAEQELKKAVTEAKDAGADQASIEESRKRGESPSESQVKDEAKSPEPDEAITIDEEKDGLAEGKPPEKPKKVAGKGQGFPAGPKDIFSKDNSETQGFPEPSNTPLNPEEGKTYSPWEMPIRLESPSKGVKGINAPEIIDQLAEDAKAFGGKTPIRVGKVGGKALGVHIIKSEVIRLRTANDVLTGAHELGHAIEKIVFGYPKGGPWVKGLIETDMQKELAHLGKLLYGPRVPNGGYKREGFAEFMKMWLANRPQAQRQAPKFYSWFDNVFLKDFPEGRKALDKTQDMFTRWQKQGAIGRAKKSVADLGNLKERMSRVKKSMSDFFSWESHIDMLQPLRVLKEQAEEKLGKKLSPVDDPFFIGSALRTTHDARVRQMVDHAMIDLAGNPVGEPLVNIRELVKHRKDEFVIYLWAKRARALWTDNKKGPRNPGLTLEDAERIILELDNEKFQLAAQKVYDWNEGVLNYAAQSSPTFAETVRKIREVDPGFYIPLAREFRELDLKYLGGGGSQAAKGSLAKRLKGSGRRIKDPFPQMLSKARSTVKAAHNRMVLDAMIRLSKVEGMGNLIEKVPQSKVPQTVDLLEAMKKVKDFMQQFAQEKIDLDSQDTSDLAGETITFFTPAQLPRGADPIFPIWVNGKVEWYQVDGQLYEALQAMEVYRLPSIHGFPILDWMFGKPTRIFRAGTTGLRAAFGLITNPLRDVQTLYVNSQSNVHGFHLVHAWMKSMVDAFLFRTTGRKNPYLDAFIRLGGEMAQPLGQDIPQTRRAARTLFEGRVVRTLDPRNWFDFLREFLQFPESASRTSELRTLAKQVGWQPGQPMTLEQSLQLLLAAKQVTTDFTAMGEFSRVMNQIAPFYNAAIQGPRANIRAGMRNPTKFFGRALQFTALTLTLWWLNKDEEWYKQLNVRDKFLFWYFKTDIPGPDGKVRKELIRIPRAFEIGQVFSGMPEMFFDSWYRQDPKQVKEWWDLFKDVSTPNFTPVLLGEAFEQFANKDFYWQSPIVKRSLQRKPVAEQYDEYTSRIAITLGDIFNVSPARLDHAIRGIFGSVSGDVLSLLGLGPKDVDKQPEAADIPVLGVLFKRGGELGGRPKAVNEMYDTYSEALNKQQSDKNPENQRERQARLMLKDATQAISALYYVRRQTKDVNKQRKITKEIISISEEVMRNYKAGRVNRNRFSSLRKRKQLEKKRLMRQQS